MSRKIMQMHEPYESHTQNNTTGGKVILTEYAGKACTMLMKKNRLLAVNSIDSASKIDAIYIAKVKNVVKNLDACFVEIADGELCFLPFSEAQNPWLINRKSDGRILQGDELLVQVTRDALKTKQAAVSCQITLQGEYFVFTVGKTNVGISSKLSQAQKKQIKQLLTEKCITDSNGQLIQKGNAPLYGMVVRTQAMELLEENEEVFLNAMETTRNEFLNLFETALHRTCFTCIKASKMPFKTLLDHYRLFEYEEVVTNLNEAYTSLQNHNKPIRLYDDIDYPLKKLYSIETKLAEALGKTVWLKSGANLVIEQTECLTTIDVNSGKMLKGTDSDETIWKINEEAAYEVALQIRLRNLSGIIIVDFINMKDKQCEERLISIMNDLVSADPISTIVIDITPLGLMEITRKKINKSLKEQFGKV